MVLEVLSLCKILSPSFCCSSIHFLLPHLEGSEILVTLKTFLKIKTPDVFNESQFFDNLELAKENELLWVVFSSNSLKWVRGRGNYLFHTLRNRCRCYLEIQMNMPISTLGLCANVVSLNCCVWENLPFLWSEFWKTILLFIHELWWWNANEWRENVYTLHLDLFGNAKFAMPWVLPPWLTLCIIVCITGDMVLPTA